MTDFLQQFELPADDNWTFSGHTSISHLTHGYHRYPAKFVPKLVQKLIETYTLPSDRIVDIFAGCGTTLVESKIHGRECIGVDVNPVAAMITQAKITPIAKDELETAIEKMLESFSEYDCHQTYFGIAHPRIDYWFRTHEKNKITFLYLKILAIECEKKKTFFLCALSNILKPCSRWLQSSTKPQVDPDRNDNIPDPFIRFKFQLNQMKKMNGIFFDELKSKNHLRVPCKIKIADARRTGIRTGSVGAIITSPPYVTSYEYADIHQLTAYWFEYIAEISLFRKKFIGTFYSNSRDYIPHAPIAKIIVDDLLQKSKRHSREVANYFKDVWSVSREMNRILKPEGLVCLVIGNTKLRDVDIKSAQVFAETLSLNGFNIAKIIKRQIPNKLIPTIRDAQSGRFTTLDDRKSVRVYPEEYIIVARKKDA